MDLKNRARASMVAGVAAMLLGFAGLAKAQLDLTPATGVSATKVMFAKEALLTNATTTVDGVKYYNVTNASSALDITLDRRILAGAFYRVTLENMVFLAAATPAGEDSAKIAGGAANDNFIVFSTGTGTVVTSDITIAATTFGVLPDKPGNITMKMYRDTFDALADTNAIDNLGGTLSGAVTVVDGLSEKGTPGSAMASAESEFTQLAGDADTTQVGRLRITGDLTARIAAGTVPTNVGDLLSTTDPIIVTFKGDFSVGDWSLNTMADCSGATGDANVLASSVGDDGDMEDAKLTPTAQPDGDTNVDWYLCLKVDEDNDMPLPTEAFTATVKYAALANALGRDEQTVTVGSIGRDGTTVHIPYLTTYDGYNHRVTLTNRSTRNTTYRMSFRPEVGVTATPRDMASGMLMAGETKTLRAQDVVTLENGSRTHATVTMPIAPSNVDVSTTLVNQENRTAAVTVHLSDNGLK